MRRPPSPAKLPAYPVAGGLGLMAIAVTLMTGFGRWPIERFEVDPTAFRREPWRLLASALPHLDVFHLAFNVYWLWVFGTLLEEVLGHVRLLGLVALFAAGSAAAQYALETGAVGLSGVDYGLFALLWVLTARDRRFVGAVDKRTVQMMVAWFFFCIAATHFKIMAIGNVAHGAGAALGALVGAAMLAGPLPRRVGAAAGAVALLGASFAGATVLRPRVNLSHDGLGSALLGYQAIQEGRLDDAIAHYRDSIAMNDGKATTWYNLGIAYDNGGRGDEAVAAFRRSVELDPASAPHRGAYLSAAHRVAEAAQQRGDHEKAAALLRDVVGVDRDDGLAWLALSHSYHALGRADAETEARNEALRLLPQRAP